MSIHVSTDRLLFSEQALGEHAHERVDEPHVHLHVELLDEQLVVLVLAHARVLHYALHDRYLDERFYAWNCLI